MQNLPALTAVLEDVRAKRVDQIVIGGDVVPGPMPRETLDCLLGLDIPTHFIHGNGDLADPATPRGENSHWGAGALSPLGRLERGTANKASAIGVGFMAERVRSHDACARRRAFLSRHATQCYRNLHSSHARSASVEHGIHGN